MEGHKNNLSNNLKCINDAQLSEISGEVLRLCVSLIRYTKNLNYYSLYCTQKKRVTHSNCVTLYAIKKEDIKV
jgi:hypothetical protein